MEPTIARAEVSSFKVKVRFSDGTVKVIWRGRDGLPHPLAAHRFVGLTELEARYLITTGFPDSIIAPR